MDKKRIKREAKKIIISGIVQGVGFRPLVYHIALKNYISGTVKNIGGMVEIIAIGKQDNINQFLNELENYEYGNHEIVNIEIVDIDTIDLSMDSFKIIESTDEGKVSLIPPDLPVCSDCERELELNTDRRFENPFISCMSCGPRYTVIESLPYDRKTTTMVDFEMCSSCSKEYSNPSDRRFHAQTISCDECGSYLIFDEELDGKVKKIQEKNYKKINQDNLNRAIKVLKSGGIIAVKGIGGYHFACSPFIEETVKNLRKLKGREEKPFAVMFENIEAIEEYCFLTREEEILLKSKERPIVLLYTKDKKMAYSTTKGSMYCGAFLPYTALQLLILKECGPLIMTSANISDRPIIREDIEMLSIKSEHLKGVLYNTRRIVRSVDDSVAKIIDGKMQLVRRSRGFVPYPIALKKSIQQIFAAGGDLKAAFCLYDQGHAFVSQYFGDLVEETILEEYKKSHKDLSELLKIHPELIVCDMHPNYLSSKFAKSLGKETLFVQHHHAHIASVMAENNLDEKVIGVVFDGTGYGTDGNIWGGEFLVCEGSGFKRSAHLEYTPMIGGDSSMKDAKKTATCFLLNSSLQEYIEDDRKNIIEAAVINHINTVETSSMGRLFDAVSSILNIGVENTYEGECAVNLEKAAWVAKQHNLPVFKMEFEVIKKEDIIHIGYKKLLKELVGLRVSQNINSLALGFHYAVVDMMVKVCNIISTKEKTKTVALSGGVFQNTILVEEAIKRLRENGFIVYINRKVPSNDGGISLGQIFLGLKR